MRKTPLTLVNTFGASPRSSSIVRLKLSHNENLVLPSFTQKERKAIHRLNATGLRSVIKLLFGHKTGASHLKRRTVALKWLRDRKNELQQQFVESDVDSDVESDVEETDSDQSVSSVEET